MLETVYFQNLQLPPGLTMPHSDILMFPSITQSDAGAYQCVANNGFGHPATDTITVLVKRKLLLKTLSSNF